ncbi:Multidrug resistance protein MexB [Lacunisphaera limnophila]|uniref:Multidrug resistance protein MexB n=1 Tax=Lacunisphaera limnophila TaxID=1838286 RepID=A0A1D8ATB0_9BACT|nr:efflux RND transporter permease subunit [Lacunisphaera limnophila]AOS44144.1 Multidrug resistance protein MexB [Lacunisphaera limnophila]
MSAPVSPPPHGFAGRLAEAFTDSRLTPLAVIASLLLGVFAVFMLPREEEPQIKVPMVDVIVAMPGATAHEVENRVTRPMEKLLWEIPGVEYLYSTSSPGRSLVIVRFQVGSDLEQSLVRLNQKLQANTDRIPPGVSAPLIKPRTIDDVPVAAVTLHSTTHDHLTLRRLAAQLDDAIKALPEVAETTLIGGVRRQLRVQVDPVKLASRQLTLDDLAAALRAANARSQDGALPSANRALLIETGAYFHDAADVANLVLGTWQSRPIFLRDVATIVDGPSEPADYVLFGRGTHASAIENQGSAIEASEEAAVTLSIAKRPGANAVTVVRAVEATVARLQGVLLPADVAVTFTRNYGETASEKSNELLLHMGIAVFGVALLILFFLGWRESLVVLLAIPVTLGLTLLVFYLYGYTLNRITLFALIFSIGILVDDAIVVVENIVRHQRLPSACGKSLHQIAVEAVSEVGNPTVLATWAVIAAVLPMAFVGGLMGPYMRPIPIGASAAMLFSLVVAFTVTPWAALRVLGRHAPPVTPDHAAVLHDQAPDTFFTRLYHRIMDPMIARSRWRWSFLGFVAVLLLGAMAFVPAGLVKIKMLPFDNKSEFQVILDLPEGSTLEETTRVARELAAALRTEPEVRDYQIYAGTASPFNFNGLVRHYFMRRGANVADIQVNLLPKHERSAQSHAVAERIRPRLAAIAAQHGATLAVAEVPPGPPVLQTLVAEIYGPSEASRLALAGRVKDIFAQTEGVVDIDWYVEEQQPTIHLRVDRTKAALHGISVATISRTIQTAVTGAKVDLLHQPLDREDVDLVLELPRALRSRPEDLLSLQLRSDHDEIIRAGERPLIPLGELVTLERTPGERNLYRKNLRPVVYVTGDVAGAVASPAYALFAMNRAIAQLDGREFGGTRPEVALHHLTQPDSELEPSIKWDGEWHVTLEVFRDLGLAFAAVCILIYMLLVSWFKSYLTPFLIMIVIPLSLIGILPAHAAMGAFFTATSMIGFMAGAGIVVRNSIILVDFIELRRAQGLPLAEAVVEAGAVRFRPMLLTALAVIVGASVILADPIFQGLALSLMAGEVASLLISRFAVPVLYYMMNIRHDPPAGAAPAECPVPSP